MNRPLTDDEIAALSDEELANMDLHNDPSMQSTGEGLTGDEEDPDDDDAGHGTDESDGEGDSDSGDGGDDTADGDGEDGDLEDTGGDADSAGSDKADGDANDDDLADGERNNPLGSDNEDDSVKADKAEDKTKSDKGDEDFDYKAAYLALTQSFRANGKEIKLNSPEELIQLAQKGANYTQKMQALQPHLKVVRMLENNGLLDENKLSFLVDLDQKSPEAIQKFLKDAGIDPMDIDVNADSTYKPVNRSISDTEMRFTAVLDEVSSTPVGKETIQVIQQTWDQASKEKLWDDPDIVRVVATHREKGWYDQISQEVERRKMLGHYMGVPFLEAYQLVGNELTQAQQPQATAGNTGNVSQNASPQRKVTQRTRSKRKPVDDNKQARAAAPSKSGNPNRGPAKDFNPLAMSDEEFEQQTSLGHMV